MILVMSQSQQGYSGDELDIAGIVADIRHGLAFVQAAQGYGAVVIKIELRQGGITAWSVAPEITRKPHTPKKLTDVS